MRYAPCGRGAWMAKPLFHHGHRFNDTLIDYGYDASTGSRKRASWDTFDGSCGTHTEREKTRSAILRSA